LSIILLECFQLILPIKILNDYLGGYEDEFIYVAHAYAYNGHWATLPDLLRPRAGHRSVIFDNSILHIGGYNNQEEQFDM